MILLEVEGSKEHMNRMILQQEKNTLVIKRTIFELCNLCADLIRYFGLFMLFYYSRILNYRNKNDQKHVMKYCYKCIQIFRKLCLL